MHLSLVRIVKPQNITANDTYCLLLKHIHSRPSHAARWDSVPHNVKTSPTIPPSSLPCLHIVPQTHPITLSLALPCRVLARVQQSLPNARSRPCPPPARSHATPLDITPIGHPLGPAALSTRRLIHPHSPPRQPPVSASVARLVRRTQEPTAGCKMITKA